MRTTLTLADDVAAAAVEKLRRERSIGLSEAVNGWLERDQPDAYPVNSEP